MLCYILLWMRVCFGCVCFSFSLIRQEIYWEECLQNDLFFVGWDVKPKLNRSCSFESWLCTADCHQV